jgi:cardiolipin synthase
LSQLPNLVTCLRLLLAPALAYLIIRNQYGQACIALLLAGLTDWLDGWLARKMRLSSKTGVILDPTADKIMLVFLFVSMTFAGLTPVWLFGLILGRDLVIVIGSLLLRLFREVHSFRPSLSGKVSTFFQIIYLLLALLGAALPSAIVQSLTRLALALTALFTTISGFGYVRLGIRLTRRLPA